jgi:putative heme iron utilization protein
MEHRGEALSESDVARIVSHMNEEHTDALRRYAEVYADMMDVESVHMKDLDAGGMVLCVTSSNSTTDIRIDFERPVQTPDDAHRLLVDLAIQARDRDEA